jgi:bacillithiol biosynthesis cysteine-adding enzyme BshC
VNVGHSSEEIQFRAIPGFSKLFLDYVEVRGPARAYFAVAPELESLVGLGPALSASSRASVTELVAVLRRRNASFGMAPAVARNLERLATPGTIAVVSGQQLGLFGGPLYTIYKALTAVRLAERLTECGIEAVPVFWMEGEDHDLAEVTHLTLRGQAGDYRTVDFRPVLFGDVPEEARSISTVELTAGIEQVLAELAATIPDSPGKLEALRAADDAYRPGRTFADAFGKLMASLLGYLGLILLDPSDAGLKQLVSSLFERAVLDSEEIRALLVERNGALAAAGYHAQVSIQDSSTLLFLLHEGQRCAVVARDGGFALKGKDRRFSRRALAELAVHEPWRFSANVLLRPLIQDYLLPTVAYVAGPAEVAYFAQLEPLYRTLGLSMPAIWPRSSLTLVEPEIENLIEGFRLDLADCICAPDGVLRDALEIAGANEGSRKLRAITDTLEREIELLRPGLVTAEASLGAALDTAKRKILHNTDTLQAKILQAGASRNELLTSRVTRVLQACRPSGNLQERELNILPFLAAFSFKLIDRLYERIDPERFSHRVLTL